MFARLALELPLGVSNPEGEDEMKQLQPIITNPTDRPLSRLNDDGTNRPPREVDKRKLCFFLPIFQVGFNSAGSAALSPTGN